MNKETQRAIKTLQACEQKCDDLMALVKNQEDDAAKTDARRGLLELICHLTVDPTNRLYDVCESLLTHLGSIGPRYTPVEEWLTVLHEVQLYTRHEVDRLREEMRQSIVEERGGGRSSDSMISMRRFLSSEDGPTAVEYAVMFALIIVVGLVATHTLGTSLHKPS